jgi:vacuolar-type H+-ATPase subunit I/STV1
MIEWFYLTQLAAATLIGALLVSMGLLAKRKPSGFSVGATALVELLLLVQLVLSIALVVSGASAKQDTVEFLAYLIVALMIPIGAAFWALIERTRWSTVVLGVAGLTVAVMLVRMNQIWTGIY